MCTRGAICTFHFSNSDDEIRIVYGIFKYTGGIAITPFWKILRAHSHTGSNSCSRITASVTDDISSLKYRSFLWPAGELLHSCGDNVTQWSVKLSSSCYVYNCLATKEVWSGFASSFGITVMWRGRSWSSELREWKPLRDVVLRSEYFQLKKKVTGICHNIVIFLICNTLLM